MALLRYHLKLQLEQRGFRIVLPEEKDVRFPPLPADSQRAARVARDGRLSGIAFVSENWRREVDGQKFFRVVVDFKLVQISDGRTAWGRRVPRAVAAPSATNVSQASSDAVKEIVREHFSG
jgi:hypothetical protein